MAKTFIKFFRGSKGNYNAETTHKDCVYFATDTAELLMNDVSYGLSKDNIAMLNNSVKSVAYEPSTNTFTIINNSGVESTFALPVAGTSQDGLMSAADKKALDGIPAQIATEKERAEGIESGLRTELDTAKSDIIKLLGVVGENGTIVDTINAEIGKIKVDNDVAVEGQYISTFSQENGKVTVTRADIVNPNDNILSKGATGITADIKLKALTPEEIQQLENSANIKAAYKLVGKNDQQIGTEIVKIEKENSLQDVNLQTSFTDEGQVQEIVFKYAVPTSIEPTGIKEVKLNISSLISQSEFKNGLNVADTGEVSVKLDTTTENRDDYLKVDANGIRTEGIKAAIDSADLLDNDIVVTGVTVGNFTSGKTIKKGTSIEALLKQMLLKEIGVYSVKPTVSLNVTGTAPGTYEVGTTITPTLKHTYTDGSFKGNTGYSYTLAANCVQNGTSYYRNSESIGTDTGAENNGIADSFTLPEGTTTYNCETKYLASTEEPVNNMGSKTGSSIVGGTAVSGKSYYYGKRYCYAGAYADQNTFVGDSSHVKQLATKLFEKFTNIKFGAGMTQVVIAFPATMGTLLDVVDLNGMNAHITGDFTLSTATVAGANSEAGVTYNIYVKNSGIVLGDINYDIVIG